MKAIVIHEYGPPDVMKYEDVPDPIPRRGEIRVTVHAATINRTLDVSVRAGNQKQRGIKLPLIPGVDCAGIVDMVGPGVTRWKVGDHVAAAGRMPLDPAPEFAAPDGSDYGGPHGMIGIKRPGAFAEKIVVAACAADSLPKSLNLQEAAVVLRHCPTAWNLLMNVAQLKKDEWVLIMGASGNLGSIGIQIAKNVIGAKVIAAAGSAERAAVGKRLGADYAIDYSKQDLLAEVKKITGGKGVNVLYDNIANPKILPIAFHCLGEKGRLVTAGAHGGPNVTIDFFHLYDNKITIKGMPGSKAADRPKCYQAADEGKIKVRIAHVLPLSKAAEAHRMVEADPGMGKIVLDPTLG
jgi:NADPH:quinone reductase-like Zn-dependent oxidoreductase